MALRSLGLVTTVAGTLVRLTKNETDPTAHYPVHSFLVEAHQSNTGRVFIGVAGFNKATGVGVLAYLPIPTTSAVGSFAATVTFSPNHFDCKDVWLDVEVNGEGAYISAIRG